MIRVYDFVSRVYSVGLPIKRPPRLGYEGIEDEDYYRAVQRGMFHMDYYRDTYSLL